MANNNTSIVHLTKERIGDNDKLQTFVQHARAVANVIFPETLPFSDKYCRLGAEVVTVDANNDKHVYQNESGGFCLHLSKLNEIAKAAKIRVIGSRILERKVDERGQVTFISHEVTVQYRTVSGEMITEAYTGKYDYFNDLANKKEGQVKSRRKHAEALAESNALTRAFNKVLPQLPQNFKKTDFDKPFLIPFVTEDKELLIQDLPKEDQIAIKRDLARKRLGLTEAIYPTPSETIPPLSKAEDLPNTPYSEVTNGSGNGNKPPEDAQIIDATPELSWEEKNAILAKEFKDVPQSERTEKILNLCKLTGTKNKSGAPVSAKQVEVKTPEEQVSFIEKLLNMLPEEIEDLP